MNNPSRRLPVTVVLVAFVASLVAGVSAENWPSFRGPTRQGISAEKDLPLTWSATENLAWKTEVPGASWSSPIVWNDRVYLSTATDGGKSCRLLAIDRANGKVLWNTEVFQQEPGHKQEKNSYATPTPATDGERVYAVFGDGSFAAVNQDGSVAWTNRDTKFYSQHGLGASPLLHGDLLIMSFDGSSRGPDTKVGWQVPWEEAALVALDKKSGKERWRASRGPSRIAHVSPMIIRAGNRDELLSCAGDVIQGFNPNTGERLWTARSEGEGVVPSPAFANNLIFTASGFGKPTIRTIRAGGSGEITASHIAWEQRKGVPSQSSLVFANDHIFAVTDGGVAACFAAGSGDVVWQERVGGNFCASPIVSGDRIYFLSEQGETTVVKAGPEFEILAKNAIGERCLASMAISQGKLFIRSDRHLWCIGR